MRWLLAFLIAFSGVASAHDDGDYQIQMYSYDSSGRWLLRDLQKFAVFGHELLAPFSDAESKVSDEIDSILASGLDQLLSIPSQNVTVEVAEDILWVFLQGVGSQAFGEGRSQKELLEFIEKRVQPFKPECEIYLTAQRPESKYDH